jgi:hypothetical protein
MYMAFCGAPAHLTGVLGNVKMALPLLKFWRSVLQNFLRS